MPTCRSSGVQTASAVVNAGRCKLISIHAQLTGVAATTVKVFDNASAASGTELARIIMENPNETIEFDMHGVLALNGLYLDISTGGGTGAAVSVEFA
tara:strand:- start:1104 stop:1394 length:291 start_codon:yes stop_codon:yes gene_type:complete